MTSPPFDLAGLDPTSERLVSLVLRIVAGDFAARGPMSGSGDGADAITLALNMLAESFQVEQRARVRAEALLADAVASYELAPDALCSCDLDALTILKCNPALARAVGVPATALLGRSLLAHVLPGARAALRGAVDALVAHGTPLDLDVELAGATAPWIASVTGALAPPGDGSGARVLLSLRDVTATRRLATELAQAQRLDALGQLAGGVAHDFNNLLTVIISSVDLLALRVEDPHHREELGIVRQAGERAAALTRDLLAFARQQPTPTEAVTLDDVVRQAHPVLARLAGDGARLDLDLGAPAAAIRASAGQLDQALANLVVNARDAMPDGGHVTIRTRLRRVTEAGTAPAAVAPGAYVELEVADTGTGIPDDVRARIFEPFFTTKARGRGTGLGLAIVYGVVRQARGHISVDSTPGRGTRFTLRFPLASAAPAPGAPRPTPRHGAVLVVEDDDLVRRLTARALTEAGFDVLEAAGGDEAVALVRAHGDGVALVVSDVVMPGTDGVAALAQIRAIVPAMPCVFVTGYAHEEARLTRLPDVTVLPKPFLPPALIATVHGALAARAP